MKHPIAFSLLSLVCAGSLSAAVLAEYDFTGSTGTTLDATPDFTLSGISATAISQNNLSLFGYTLVGTNPALQVRPSGTQASASPETAFTDANYFTFTVTPDVGQTISLSSLDFDAKAGFNSGVRAFYVASSVGGFTAANVLKSDSLTGTLGTSFAGYSIDLTGAAFQNLTSAATFRFYIQADTTGRSLEFDNIVLNGTVSAVPEPAAAASLLGLAAVAFAVSRRRRASR